MATTECCREDRPDPQLRQVGSARQRSVADSGLRCSSDPRALKAPFMPQSPEIPENQTFGAGLDLRQNERSGCEKDHAIEGPDSKPRARPREHSLGRG